MIGYLRGTVLRSSPERVLLDIRGVGYEVHVPLSTFYELDKSPAEAAVGLFVYTHLREGALELFGFWTEREKQLFEKLIAVSGIGPKLARVILSGMAPGELLGALAGGDTARLATIPGIGKKTAERMVVELRDRVQEMAAELPEAAPGRVQDEELVQALEGLGYKPKVAARAVARAREELPEGEFSELLRASLKRLSRA